VADNNVLEQMYKCLRCGWCRDLVQGNTNRVCPAREVSGFESACSRGRIMLARGIVEGQIEYKPELINHLYTCFGCGMCEEHCPLEVETLSIFRWMREEVVRLNLDVPEGVHATNKTVEEYGNPFGLAHAQRGKWARDLGLPAKGAVVYFTGCYESYRSTKVARESVKILQEIGNTPAYLGEEELCCGVPQIWNGSTFLARELAERNVDALQKAGAETVIFTCAGCYNAFKKYYPELLGDALPFKTAHVTELFADKIAQGELELPAIENGVKVTYHDPCHLGRHLGVYEPPRTILRQLYPESFVEMARNKENAWCCGGGGIVFSLFKELTDQVAATRAAEAEATGAGLIVSTCPTCLNILRLPAQRLRIRVDNIISQMAKAMEIKA
jgi:Fe-S oxidoreductase